jgi:hypothetical protein
MKHYKYDLYTDEQLGALATKAGDVLELNVPSASGFTWGRHKVLAIDMADAKEYNGKHYTRVTLELESMD